MDSNYIGFPDYVNIIGYYSNTSFITPQDCWAAINIMSGWTNASIQINKAGILFQQIRNTDSYPIRTTTLIPLKKGDVVDMSDKTNTNNIAVTLYAMR